jgi:hypothetical protein
MRSVLTCMLAAVICTAPALARGVHVRGYTTKNGTYVAPHYRSAPDHSRSNNWSTHGNVNPYTGKVGNKNPYDSSYKPYGYSTPSKDYYPPSSGYVPPSGQYTPRSYGYSTPSKGYTPRNNGNAQPSYSCLSCSSNQTQTTSATNPPQQDAIYLSSGAVKLPARTKSGYCLQAPYDYVGTGSLNYPAISSAMPRCEEVQT